MSKFKAKPVTAVLGAAFLATAISPMATADTSPFSATPLNTGYDIVNADDHADHEGKCGEGKCGESDSDSGKDKGEEGKCGEGKCGS